MPEALKCPSCAAPLEYPPGGGPTMRCPYCQTTIMLPGNSSSTTESVDLGAAFGPMIGQALNMAQVADLFKSGRKIEAIKIYRQTSGADLATAKAAVERMAAAHNVGHNASPRAATIAATIVDPAAVTKLAASGMKLGLVLTISIMLFTALILGIVFYSVHQAIPHTQLSTPAPTFTMPAIQIPAAPPAPPAFAHMELEFGAEGIGAGHFKDSRSIAVDNVGHIYVGEYSDGRIQAFDQKGNFLAEWSLGKDKYLQNLTCDLHGNLAACVSGHIMRYEGLTGMPLGEVDNIYQDNTIDYSDAYTALNGDIYAIAGEANIATIGPDGHVKSMFNVAEKVGEDISIDKLAVLPTGDIFALNRMQGIFKFAPDGRYINRFGGGEGTGPDHLLSANNIAVDSNGRIYVSDDGPAIHVYNSDGHYLDSFGGNDVVFGLAITPQNEIFACFRNDHVIRKFVVDRK